MSETWSHWFVGADNTGDITIWDNLLAFRENVKKDLEEVHLVCAVCTSVYIATNFIMCTCMCYY